MCPFNDRDDPRSEAQRNAGLRTALSELAPILREYGIIGFIEPLGFEECALRRKRTAVDAIKAIGGWMYSVWCARHLSSSSGRRTGILP